MNTNTNNVNLMSILDEIGSNAANVVNDMNQQKDNTLIDTYQCTGRMTDYLNEAEAIISAATYQPSLPVQTVMMNLRAAIDTANDVLLAEMQRRAEDLSAAPISNDGTVNDVDTLQS